MNINCVILDDEPLAVKLMEEYASRVPFLNVTGAFTSSVDAQKFIAVNPPDLLLIDVNMPDISGIELLSGLNKNIMRVFCTAYPDFALKAYDLEAIDYLVKPFSFDRFLRAVCKAQEQSILRHSYSNKVIKETETDKFLFVKSEYSLVKLDIDEIILLEGLKDYVKIHLSQRPRPVLTLQSLRSLEEKLPARFFYRVHKSFVINIRHVQSVQRNQVMIANREVPLGNQYKDGFISLISDNTAGK